MSLFSPKVSLEEHESEVAGLQAQLQAEQEAYASFVASIAEPAAWFDRVMKKRIIVHTVRDQSVEGSLSEVTPDGIILRAAALLRAGGPPTTMAGEVFIPRAEVAFAQLDE